MACLKQKYCFEASGLVTETESYNRFWVIRAKSRLKISLPTGPHYRTYWMVKRMTILLVWNSISDEGQAKKIKLGDKKWLLKICSFPKNGTTILSTEMKANLSEFCIGPAVFFERVICNAFYITGDEQGFSLIWNIHNGSIYIISQRVSFNFTPVPNYDIGLYQNVDN